METGCREMRRHLASTWIDNLHRRNKCRHCCYCERNPVGERVDVDTDAGCNVEVSRATTTASKVTVQNQIQRQPNWQQLRRSFRVDGDGTARSLRRVDAGNRHLFPQDRVRKSPMNRQRLNR